MGRIITIIGCLTAILSCLMVWGRIEFGTMHEVYSGFAKDPSFAAIPSPGMKTIMMAVPCLILAIINRKITQYPALILALAMLAWGIYQLRDKIKYFAIQDGWELGTGIYIHAFAGVICVIGIVITLRKLKINK